MMRAVRIYEVGPRDGLQNEKTIIPAAQKIRLIDLLSRVGFSHIEAASFVSPKWVPQMADAAEVMAGIERFPGVTYAALTPNLVGFRAALAAAADEVAIFGSASETFSRENINCSISRSLERFRAVAKAAISADLPVRGYVSCVAGCPYEGEITPKAVAAVATELLAMGCYEVSLGDTIGRGTPQQISELLDHMLLQIPAGRMAGHFHDTSGQALDNVRAALAKGIRTFDSAIGGLGGCPYAPGAKGNVSTAALAHMLVREGWETGLDLQRLQAAETYLHREIGGLAVR